MFLFFLIIGIYSFTKNGVTIWKGRNIKRWEWQATMLVSCDNDVLKTIAAKCPCSFGDTSVNLDKGDTLNIKWSYKNSGTMTVYVNNEHVYQGGNIAKCFFCIQKNFK